MTHKEGRDTCQVQRQEEAEMIVPRSERQERLAPYGITSGCNLKMGTNGLTAQRHRLTDLEKLLGIKKPLRCGAGRENCFKKRYIHSTADKTRDQDPPCNRRKHTSRLASTRKDKPWQATCTPVQKQGDLS